MVGPIRSTTGCWTCKLRKKKCDEAKPACSVCSSLHLDCSGYGSRPGWMDGGVREKEVAANIREKVKKITSQKKRDAMKHRQKPPEEDIQENVPIPLDHPDSQPPYPSQLTNPEYSLKQIATVSQDKPLLIDGPPRGLTPQNAADYITQNESVLLMHYLDVIFPYQFQFYQPSLEDGGRGWLLSLLMQTKPLYHAALSVAAYHRQMLYCLTGGMAKACFTTEALHLQYDIAVTELRKYLDGIVFCKRPLTLTEDVQLLCSIVLFISTEAFISSTKSWQLHLTAATAVFPNIQKQLQDGTSKELATPTLRAALSFFASVGLWYDIISCATTGSKPFELDGNDLEEYIHFDKVMGCEDWVMFAIKDIAKLDYWKNDLKAKGQLSVRELVSRGNDIEALLNRGLENLKATQQSETQSSTRNGAVLGYDQSDINPYVTRVYCCAALVYLHVVVSGAYPDLPEVRQSVEQTIEALKALPNKDTVYSLIWPLCIAGCMAQKRDESFFRGLADSADLSDSPFGASKARIIFEECWRLRRLDPASGPVDWRTAMNILDFNILLK